MVGTRSKEIEEIRKLMMGNVEDAVRHEVLELTDIVEKGEHTNQIGRRQNGETTNTQHPVYGNIINDSIQDKNYSGSEITKTISAIQSLSTDENFRSVVDLVVKNEIKKWLNKHLPQIVQDEVRKVIGGVVENLCEDGEVDAKR
jgi:cell pole-organizing protein PopZ